MRIGTIASAIGMVVVLVLVVPFTVYAVPGVIGADYSFTVLSGSMEPEISAGDAVVVDSVDPATVREGDVITYVRGDDRTPVTHRVIGVLGAGGDLAFETQGDANDNPDASPVPAENVIGTVVLTLPFVGYVVQFVNTPAGFLLFVGVPIGLLLATEVWSFVRGATGTDATGGDRDAAERGDRRDDSAGDVDELRDADERAGTATEADLEPDESTDGFAVNVADLTMTVGLLALVTPYAVYVAVRIPSTTTIAAAFASGFSTLALGALWLYARAGRSDERPEPPAPSADELDPSASSADDRESDDPPTDDLDSDDPARDRTGAGSPTRDRDPLESPARDRGSPDSAPRAEEGALAATRDAGADDPRIDSSRETEPSCLSWRGPFDGPRDRRPERSTDRDRSASDAEPVAEAISREPTPSHDDLLASISSDDDPDELFEDGDSAESFTDAEWIELLSGDGDPVSDRDAAEETVEFDEERDR